MAKDPKHILYTGSHGWPLYNALRIFSKAREIDPALSLSVCIAGDPPASPGDDPQAVYEHATMLNGVAALLRGQGIAQGNNGEASIWLYPAHMPPDEATVASGIAAMDNGLVPLFSPVGGLAALSGVPILGFPSVDRMVRCRFVYALLGMSIDAEQVALLGTPQPIGTVGYIGTALNFSQFTQSLAQMVGFSYETFVQPGQYLHLDSSIATSQIAGRNELVAKMQGDWLIQIDTDHDFEPDLAYRLLQAFEGERLDVLVGYYGYKQAPHNPVLYKYDGEKYRNILAWGDRSVNLIPIDAAGGGCLLVRASVFRRMREHFGVMPFDACPPYKTDDFNFFERCRILGIKCWCMPQVECKHLSVTGYGLDDFQSTFAQPQHTHTIVA